MPRQSGFGWAWRVPLALAGSLAAATASGYLLTRGLPLDDPLERLYAGLFGARRGGVVAPAPAAPSTWCRRFVRHGRRAVGGAVDLDHAQGMAIGAGGAVDLVY
ncbi:hypothetical protein PLES 07071 [Pseudomonas aeruginosa]|uniref:hypothetical protein n=1 Tax=Pseudomonas aeruginosa TaxID=287 RepID=UPI0004EF9923|nr:hypothetical protein [Pseudomonas aeruginosa]CDO85505.1 hypothetical protein PLES 07071 [Pseudomonas aeruginosa]